MIPNYSRVQLITDQDEHEGARRGMIGYVIECYTDDKYEVEFSDSNGITIATIAAREEDLVLAPEIKLKPWVVDILP